MAFIEKNDPVVLNIKLTSKGRELLSKGKLTFNYFGIGDSEIDYEFNRESKIDPFLSNILRPVDGRLEQLSFITRELSGDKLNPISTVPCIPTVVENDVNPIGFFNSDATEFLVDASHIKQPDMMVMLSDVTGGTTLKLKKAPTYLAVVNEPIVNDIVLVKWSNPLYVSGDTTGYTINKIQPTPYLYYRISEIVSGSLTGDDLIVEVDRELPDFSLVSGTDNHVGAMAFYNLINYTGDTCYSGDNTDDALIAFLQNCQCPTVVFPFWNMSIIYTENVVGVKDIDKQFGKYGSNGFGGFVSYIQNQNKSDENYKRKLGVIHYTNPSVGNTYGEGFYGDPLNIDDANKIPTLDIPTIMWHKSTGTTLGVQLKASGGLKYLTGATKSLNTRYYDLADESGNVVGKVFYDIKVFVIDDQELLFAMSYKANRSWTLPDYGYDINANVTFGCPYCVLEYGISGTSPSYIGGNDGTLTVHNIMNNLGSFTEGQILLKVSSGDTQYFFGSITGDTTINGLTAGHYVTEMYDIASTNCVVSGSTTITSPTSSLTIIESRSTGGRMVAYFPTGIYNNNPGRIRIEESVVAPNGFNYKGFVTIIPTGGTVPSTTGISSSDIFNTWAEVPSGGYVETSSLTLGQPYIVYVRDISGSDIVDGETGQTWSYHVAVGSPFVTDPSTINTTVGSDVNGNFVTISDYVQPSLNPAINPIVGDIEMSIHYVGEQPTIWTSTNNDGTSNKMYHSLSGNLVVSIREKFDYINVYEINTHNFTT